MLNIDFVKERNNFIPTIFPESGWVPQGKYDCVTASLSMYTRLPKQVVKSAIRKAKRLHPAKGLMGINAIQEAYAARLLTGKQFVYVDVKKIGTVPLDGIRCLLTVPSLNIPDRWHSIFYDGKSVFDPNAGDSDRLSYADGEVSTTLHKVRSIMMPHDDFIGLLSPRLSVNRCSYNLGIDRGLWIRTAFRIAPVTPPTTTWVSKG